MTKAKNKAAQVSVQKNKLYLSSFLSYKHIFPGNFIHLSTFQEFQLYQILLIYISTSNVRKHLLAYILFRSIIKLFWSVNIIGENNVFLIYDIYIMCEVE